MVWDSMLGTFSLQQISLLASRYLSIINLSQWWLISLQWGWACEITYVLSNLAIKFSICLFLLRIAVSKTPRVILWMVIAISGVTCSYFLLLFIFLCQPITYFWAQYTGVKGSCINAKIITTSTYIYSAVRCCSDWTCCILPACMVWKLQMNPRTKFSVCLIPGLGAMLVSISFVWLPGQLIH
jgi:hypothetical protein